ncbi:hypothetical protein V1511DRAFT_485526 [Dipodascopsis uninucleata]
MRTDTAQPANTSTTISDPASHRQIPPSPRPQLQAFSPGQQYTTSYGGYNFQGGQPRGAPNGRGPNNSFQPQQHGAYSPSHKHNGRPNNRTYSQQSPSVTPQMQQAQMALAASPMNPALQYYPSQQQIVMPQQYIYGPGDYYYGNPPAPLIYGGGIQNIPSATAPTQRFQQPNQFPTPQAQPFFPQSSRSPATAEQSPRLSSATASPQPQHQTTSTPSVKSKAIRIVDPKTLTEVNFKPAVSPSASPKPAPVPERTKTPLSSASPTPEHVRNATPTILSEDEKRERCEKAKSEVLQKINESKEQERLKREEDERLKKEEEDRLKKEEEDRLKEEERVKMEEERIKKEEEERIKKEEEERIKRKEEEELLKKQEEDRIKKDEMERIKKEEEENLKKEAERLKKEEEERAAAAAAAAAAAEEAKAKEDISATISIPSREEEISRDLDDETPLSTDSPATPDSLDSPQAPAPLPKQSDRKLKTIGEDSSVSDLAMAKSLKNAEFAEDFSTIKYPEGVKPPVSGKLKYDAEFLLHFRAVVIGKPTEDWDSRVKSTIGDLDETNKRPSSGGRSNSGAGRQGSRSASSTGSMPFGAMGQMGQLGTNASLLSSEQRFAYSNRSHHGQIDMSNPLGAPLSRTPSFGKMGQANISNIISSMPSGSMRRQGNTMRNKRPGNDRSNGNRDLGGVFDSGMSTPTDEKIEPLVVSANRWQPRKRASTEEEKAPDGSIIYPPDVVQRKVNALLNKMTLEKFDKISDQILEIVAQSKWEKDGRTLRQVIALTFEKATDEAHWSNMYARFCKKVQESLGPEITEEGVFDKNGEPVRGGALFRKYLLSKCQEQFEKGWKATGEGGPSEVGALNDEYYKVATIKRRGLGLVRFIGELYMLNMLSDKIMHHCVQSLIGDKSSEEELESLCGLLRTIGAKLDSSHQQHVEVYMQRLKDIMDRKPEPDQPKLSSRIKFMIMDVFDLRRANWKEKNADKGPKTLSEIHEAALKEQAIKELSKTRQSSMRMR